MRFTLTIEQGGIGEHPIVITIKRPNELCTRSLGAKTIDAALKLATGVIAREWKEERE